MVLDLDLTFSITRTVFLHLFLACSSIIFQLSGAVGMFYHPDPRTAALLSPAERLIKLFFHRDYARKDSPFQRYLEFLERIMGEQSNSDKV